MKTSGKCSLEERRKEPSDDADMIPAPARRIERPRGEASRGRGYHGNVKAGLFRKGKGSSVHVSVEGCGFNIGGVAKATAGGRNLAKVVA